MRHPPPWIYLLAFCAPIVVGLLGGINVWHTSPTDTSTVTLIAKTALAVVAPLASILIAMGVFAGIMIYLGGFRPGNRVLVTGGDHEGKNGIVTQRHGVSDRGWVHVHLSDDELDTTISPYQIRKVGWRSHVF